MLRPKFSVPVGLHSAWRHLRTSQTRSASRCERTCPTAEKKDVQRTCPKKQPKEVCPRPSYSFNPFGRGSGSDQEARRCAPRPVPQQPCKVPSGLHPPYSCENAPPHPAEEFRQAFAQVREEALSAQIHARLATNGVVEPMIRRNAQRAHEEAERLNHLLKGLRPKLDELLCISIVCGSREQANYYRMSDNLHAQLKIWNCENVSGENCVKSRLQQLECTVKERTDMAVDIVRTCNGSVTPNSLLLCVDLTKKDAKCILSRVNDAIKKETQDIELLSRKFFAESDHILLDLRKKMETEIKQFADHLNDCILELKNLTKNNKCK